MTELKIPLNREEVKALSTMSKQDVRGPEMQLRWLLREEAKRRGLFAPGKQNKAAERPKAHLSEEVSA